MPRELVYRVAIDTSQARRAAASIKSEIERELKTINAGAINIGGSSRSAGGVNKLANDISIADGVLKGFNNTLAVLGVGLGVQQVGRFATEMANLSTAAARSNKSFEILVGGASAAEKNIAAIQRASGGTVNTLQALQIGTQGAALGLARTSDEFERLTRSARLITTVSASINDVGGAITQLSLFAANVPSFARADQLGLSAEEVKQRMKELQAQNENLTDSNAKLEASMQLIDEKFGALLDTTEAQATGFERLKIAVDNLKLALATGPVGGFVNDIAGQAAVAVDTLTGVNYELENILARIPGEIDSLQQGSFTDGISSFLGFDPAAERSGTIKALEQSTTVLRNLQAAVEAGVPGAVEYRDAIADQTLIILEAGDASDAMVAKLAEADQWYQTVAASVQQYQDGLADAANKEDELSLADLRAASILEQQSPINDALTNRAAKSIETAGIEQSIQQLQEAKALVDQGIEALIASGVTDSDELLLRIEQIKQEALATFDEMEQSAADFSFAGMDQAFANIFENISIPESDFIPVLREYRDQAYELFNEIAAAGGAATEEQAAQLDYLSSVASAAADEQGYLAQITGELGSAFLEANPLVGELVGQLYQSEAAYRAGQISADNYAGRMYALGSQLIAYLSQAGAATSATYQLVNAFSALAGTGGEFGIGFNFAQAQGNYLQSREEQRQRDAQRKAAERAAKEAEAAAKRAAREQETAAKKAARELERGAEQAARELQSALRDVPGLFGRSQVTEGDMKLSGAGVYTDKADEYLRRLQDEVFNGKDWADVSIEDAKQALRDLGIQVADDSKIAFEQFAEAWESSVLFADEANVDKFINKEAVQLALDLQEKAKQGQENIYKAFGVAIDDAVDAAVSGASGGGISGSAATGYTIPVEAELQPIDQAAFNVATGRGAPAYTVPVQWQVIPTLGGMTPTLGTQVAPIAPTLSPTAGTELAAELAMQIAQNAAAFQGQGVAMGALLGSGIALPAGLGKSLAADLATQLNGQAAIFRGRGAIIGLSMKAGLLSQLSSTSGGATDEAASPIVKALVQSINGELRGGNDAFQREGYGIADAIKAGVAKNISTTQWQDGEIVAPVASGLITAINTQVRGTTEAFKSEGLNVASYIIAGVASGWNQTDSNGNATNSIAMGLVGAINSQFSATQNFFYAAGQPAATNVIDGFKGAFGTGTGENTDSLVTPMLSAIGTGIRANAEDFRQRGGTMAREVIFGFTSSFNSEQFKSTLIAAGETMGLYLEMGILSRIRGGALVEAIGAQVLADITETIEQPTN